MSFKILIVEDEELYADKLEMLIDQLGYEHLGTVDNSEAAQEIIAQAIPDLVLMDIHIQGSHDGIELAEIITREQPIPIIFITSMQDDLTFARASRTNPCQFLVKPFNNLQLQRTIELTVKQITLQNSQSEKSSDVNSDEEWEHDILFQDHFFIKTRQRLEKVAIDDVLYLEADGHYCQVHTAGKKFLVRISMSDLEKRMPAENFMQTHRSFLVNLKKVQSLDLQNSVIMFEEKHAPLSKRNREVVLKRLNWI